MWIQGPINHIVDKVETIHTKHIHQNNCHPGIGTKCFDSVVRYMTWWWWFMMITWLVPQYGWFAPFHSVWNEIHSLSRYALYAYTHYIPRFFLKSRVRLCLCCPWWLSLMLWLDGRVRPSAVLSGDLLGSMTHMRVSELLHLWISNRLSPARHQAIIWTILRIIHKSVHKCTIISTRRCPIIDYK